MSDTIGMSKLVSGVRRSHGGPLFLGGKDTMQLTKGATRLFHHLKFLTSREGAF